MIHVLPVNDTKKHTESVECKCNPRVDIIDDRAIVVHNAYDGRE